MRTTFFARSKVGLAALLAGLLLLLAVQPALADGMIIPQPPADPRLPRPPQLTVRYHRVNVTINGPLAVTHIDQVFVNESRQTIEGVYVFPMPADAAVSNFAMTVDGKRMEGELLTREQARRIYEDIVRQQRDPALLEYVGRGAFRASIFPIPPNAERRIEIEYSQVLTAEAGLVRYRYPLNTERFSARALSQVSINVEIRADAPLNAIYSPSHDVSVARDGQYRARIGYEAANVLPDRDFELYFSTTADPVGISVLSYKQAGEDGFFLLLASPATPAQQPAVIARDIIFVLDTSGSMQGDKFRQAQEAVKFVLDHLNTEDRFNIVDFSTDVRTYAERMAPAAQAADGRRYVSERRASGGTDINRAMLQALALLQDASRPQVIIFLTDGLPTGGVTDVNQIIANVAKAAGSKGRIFTFGVGYDVNTILLDSIAQDQRGASAYIQPNENIEAKVSDFYAKISAPVLANPQLDFGGLRVTDVYPAPLPDLFLGSQLVLVGRYRQGGAGALTLRGDVNGRQESYVYRNVAFATAGGDVFIARLWATRKIGYLLNQIRLNGANKELIDELVDLSIRYGIVTPYTSYLVQEDGALTSAGREQIALREQKALAAPAAPSGAGAVQRSMDSAGMGSANVAATPQAEQVKVVGDRAFVLRAGVWTDTRFEPDRMSATKVQFGSSAHFDLLTRYPEAGPYLALGDQVIVLLGGQAYQIGPQGATEAAAPAVSPTPPAAATPPAGAWYDPAWRWLMGLFR